MVGKRYPRAAMRERVIALAESGYASAAFDDLPDCPCRGTLHRWAREDLVFAARWKAARAWGRGVRRGALNTAQMFDDARAQALLLRVRRGEAVRDLVRTPGQPNREVLDLWRRLRPDFAEALTAAVRFSSALRASAHPFDQAVADLIVVRVAKGEDLPAVYDDPGMPGRHIVSRWRRQNGAFRAALTMALKAGHRRRMIGRRRSTEPLTEAIVDHILAGGSLHSAGRSVVGAPHHVTLYGWMTSRPLFAQAVTEACRWRDIALAERAVEAGDTARGAALRQRIGQVRGGAKPRR